MKLMKTAEEMQGYCRENNTGRGLSKDWDFGHFKVIEEAMDSDEYAIFCFEGLHNARGFSQNDGCCAYALTNKRLIIGQQQGIGCSLREISYRDLNNIRAAGQNVVIDASKWEPNIQVTSDEAQSIQRILNDLMPEILKAKREHGGQANSGIDAVDEILRYKGLCDEGIIAEEEFQEKKKQLLGAETTASIETSEIRLAIDESQYDSSEAIEERQRIAQEKEKKMERENTIWKSVAWIGLGIAVVVFITATMKYNI